jgi:predicted thioesterase
LIIYAIISQIDAPSSPTLQTLVRVFNEQYHVEEDVVNPRPKQEISASSVQSPHDTDCHYRQKDDQQVKGYSCNVTETCDTGDTTGEIGDTLNLVTNVLVDTASAADCHFLQPALEATQEIVTQKIETTNTDGAYHSVENQEYCKEKEIDLIVGAIQGKPARYDLSTDENGDLVVTDLATNTIVPSRKVDSRKKEAEPKWAILNDKNKLRYFTQKEIDTCLLRKQVAARTQTELNVRNNVEATIFQVGYHYPNAKSRYRGLTKHKMWANLRCLWINFVRIANFVVSSSSNYAQKLKNRWITPRFCIQNLKNWLIPPQYLQFLTSLLSVIAMHLCCEKFFVRIPINGVKM